MTENDLLTFLIALSALIKINDSILLLVQESSLRTITQKYYDDNINIFDKHNFPRKDIIFVCGGSGG